MNTRNYQLAVLSASSLLLAACGTNPVEQSKSNAQEEYKQQAKIASQAITQARSEERRRERVSDTV